MSYSLQTFDLATLDILLKSEGVDPIATQINNFLISAGDTQGLNDTTDLISVQSGTPPFPTSQPAQLDNITTPGTYSIDTDQYPVLQAIVLDDTGGPSNLTITGHSNVMVAAGDGGNTITLQDGGNDLVEVLGSHNTVTGGAGMDTLFGAGAGDSLTGGSGAGTWLYDAGDNATLIGGSGRFDVVEAGGGNDELLVAGGNKALLLGGSGTGDTLNAGTFAAVTLQGGSGADLVLVADGAKDVLETGRGKHESLDGERGSNSIYAGGADGSGSGSGTLLAGGNNEQVHIGAHGSDTVTGSGSGDMVFFDSQAYGTGAGITISTNGAGVTSVSFADTGQHFKISGVQTLTFSDGHIVHL